MLRMSQQQEPKAVVNEFNGRRQRLAETVRKVEELVLEEQEHEVVAKTLEPMDRGRRCFRLIGEVLVERTVGETLPAVKKNMQNLQGVIKTLTEDLKKQEKELGEFKVRLALLFKASFEGADLNELMMSACLTSSIWQAKHKIRVVDKQGKVRTKSRMRGLGMLRHE